MIVGIGVDIAEIARMERALERTPALAERLFAHSERTKPIQTLTGYFAAKEALAKSLGAPPGMLWTDALIRNDEFGRPSIAVIGTVAAVAAALRVGQFHVSISHDGGLCVAMVVAER